MHEINGPFGKGADGNNGMQWSGVGAFLFVKNLSMWAFFDCLNTIFENRGPKVAGM
jgi:hypothetical protein